MKKHKVDLSVSDDALVTAYVDAAVTNGSAIDGGDYRMANRQYDVGVEISAEFRRRGSLAEQRLLELLAHENPWVRYWAATDVLRFAHSVAEPVLEGLAALPLSLVCLSAETILVEWRKGNL